MCLTRFDGLIIVDLKFDIQAYLNMNFQAYLVIRGEEANDEDGQIKSVKVTGCSRMLSKQTKNSNKANNSTFGGLEDSSTDFGLMETDAQVSFNSIVINKITIITSRNLK